MNFASVSIGDMIRPCDPGEPAIEYEIVGIDDVGHPKIGPCVLLDWAGRGIQPFRRLKVNVLGNWQVTRLLGS